MFCNDYESSISVYERERYRRGIYYLNVNLNENSTENFSQVLIKDKLAYEYRGDTKMTEEEQLKELC